MSQGQSRGILGHLSMKGIQEVLDVDGVVSFKLPLIYCNRSMIGSLGIGSQRTDNNTHVIVATMSLPSLPRAAERISATLARLLCAIHQCHHQF